MKAGAFLLFLLWFAAATFAGYRLATRSFAWVDLPNFGLLVEAGARTGVPSIDLNALKGQIPPKLMEQAKSLSPRQLLCLQASISPDHVQAALQGQLTPQERIAVNGCLK